MSEQPRTTAQGPGNVQAGAVNSSQAAGVLRFLAAEGVALGDVPAILEEARALAELVDDLGASLAAPAGGRTGHGVQRDRRQTEPEGATGALTPSRKRYGPEVRARALELVAELARQEPGECAKAIYRQAAAALGREVKRPVSLEVIEQWTRRELGQTGAQYVAAVRRGGGDD